MRFPCIVTAYAVAWLSCASVVLRAEEKAVRIGSVRCGKVLFLGNSITRHGPLASIGWSGDWGMAASSADKDFVSQVVAALTKASGQRPEVRVRNIADFERRHDTFDLSAELKEELAFEADLIVIAIGENVPALNSDAARAAYAKAFAQLIEKLDGDQSPLILVRSTFWADAHKDKVMRDVSAAAEVTFIDIGALGKDKANYARSERMIAHDGVANHPGDRGMKAIADEVWRAIKEQATRK